MQVMYTWTIDVNVHVCTWSSEGYFGCHFLDTINLSKMVFETGLHGVVQAGLESSTCLLSECWENACQEILRVSAGEMHAGRS